MGVSTRSVKRWIALFEQTGNVVKDLPRARSARWPEQVYQHIQSFIQENPCFYVEELQVEIMKQFPDLRNVSIPTICRALRHDLRHIITPSNAIITLKNCQMSFQGIRTIVHLENNPDIEDLRVDWHNEDYDFNYEWKTKREILADLRDEVNSSYFQASWIIVTECHHHKQDLHLYCKEHTHMRTKVGFRKVRARIYWTAPYDKIIEIHNNAK